MLYTIIWGIVFAIFVIAEIATVQLVSIWLAVGALGSFIASFFSCPFWVQLLIFVVISAIALILTRPIARKIALQAVPTNAELNIGKEAMVIEEINRSIGNGRVRLDGVDWAAVSDDNIIIPAETIVVVKEIQGAKLLVALKK